MEAHDGKNWKRIADYLQGRSDVQCLHRWQKVLKPGIIKGPWTKEEDDKVIELVQKCVAALPPATHTHTHLSLHVPLQLMLGQASFFGLLCASARDLPR